MSPTTAPAYCLEFPGKGTDRAPRAAQQTHRTERMLRVWGNQGDLRSQDRVLQTRVTQGKKQRELQRFPLKYSAKYPSRRACEETTEAGEESPKRIQGSSTSAQKGLEIEFLLPSVKLANFTVHWTLRKILRKAGPQPWDQAALTLLTVLLHLIHLRSQI